MNWLKKLNPVNSLFGRIFLWFWLAAILLVVTGAWLAKQSNQSYSVRPINESQASQLNDVANRVEIMADRRPEANLSLLLGRAGQRSRYALMLLNPRSSEFTYGFPRGLGPMKAPFLELVGQQERFSIRTASGIFFGPEAIEIDGQLFYLYAGKPEPRGTFKRLMRSNPMLMFGSIILISGSLCAWFAWSLVKPIRSLQKSARKVAAGKLTHYVDFADSRGDELGELGKDFNTMTRQLDTLMEGQKRLVADISHELRSPLARLQLAIGIAQEQSEPLSDNLLKQLSRIEKEAHQIDDMIEQVLRLSRLEANVMVEKKQKMKIASLLESTIDDGLFEAQNLNIEIQVTDFPDVEITCYPNLFVSAIHNVLSNALKYCSTKVQVSFEARDLTLVVCVEDDGGGVPESDLDAMFEPFYRLSASRSRDSGGVGLGLAIVKQAINLHEGNVTATKAELGGLCVKITVPLN